MAKALEIVKQFYDAFDSHRNEWRELIADDIVFEGPLQRASGAKDFIALTEQFLQFHKATRVLKRFEDGDHACSIYEFILNTPDGGTLSCHVAEWIRVTGGKVSEIKIYYDPREFMKAFGM